MSETNLSSLKNQDLQRTEIQQNDNVPDKDQILFEDTSTDCAICLGPLYDEEKHHDNSKTDDINETHSTGNSGIVIQLKCGHKWHLNCIIEQLEHARPNPSKRLLFTGCRCAKCGVYCDHELLQNHTSVTNELRYKVDRLIEEQYQIDFGVDVRKYNNMHTSSNNNNNGKHSIGNEQQQDLMDFQRNKILEEGRRIYEFFLCSSCMFPYFGGTVECADENLVNDDVNAEQEKRLCPNCLPQVPGGTNDGDDSSGKQYKCRSPTQHRLYHIWKCRYCCNPSTFVCYGTVHFCTDCHDRNTERLRNRTNNKARPLSSIPCLGGTGCMHPKPPGLSRHINGPSPLSEQVYYCAVCITNQESSSPIRIPPGSQNLLQNPCGEQGSLNGWHNLQRMKWVVEAADIPLNDNVLFPEDVRTCFVSSYSWCSMVQRVRVDHQTLQRFVCNETANTVQIEIASYYMGRTDCPAVFKLDGIVRDATTGDLICQNGTTVIQVPVEYWERASVILNVPIRRNNNNSDNNSQGQLQQQQNASTSTRALNIPSFYFVEIFISGKDSRFWAGRFGSKVTGCSIRILDSSRLSPTETRRDRVAQVDRIREDNNDDRVQQEQRQEADTVEARAPQCQVHRRRRSTQRETAAQDDGSRSRTSHINTTVIQRAEPVRNSYQHTNRCNYQLLIWEVIFPVICLFILLWLHSKDQI